MSEQESTWNLTDLVKQMAAGRVSRITLALLLNTHLAVSVSAARTYALARLKQAKDGSISAGEDYEHRVLTCQSLITPATTFHLWLTQYATVHGFLLASGASPREWSSSRQQMEGILRMSEAKNLIDVGAFTTKVERAREITRLVLGGGNFNYDTSVPTLVDAIWQLETAIRNGSPPTSTNGLKTVESMLRGRPEKPRSGRILPGWRQMTLDELGGSERQ